MQQLLTENKISHQHITNLSNAPSDSDASVQQQAAPSSTTQPIDPEEKKQLQEQINEKIKTIDQITVKLTSLESMLESEKQAKVGSEKKFNAIQQQYNEAEKTIVDLMGKNEQITAQLNDEKVGLFFTFNFIFW